MEIGVCLAGVGLTAAIYGRHGLRELGSRLTRWRVGARWYAALLIPPALILGVLLGLTATSSGDFAPKLFWIGIVFGGVAGLFGWMGFAYPHMRASRGPVSAGITLAVLWGFWHLPVVDYLGAAGPHLEWWPAFARAFVSFVTAMRLLIARIYENTQSVLLAQLMHASSTGSLVVLGPLNVSPGQEVIWYALYALTLWIVVAIAVMSMRSRARRWPGEAHPS